MTWLDALGEVASSSSHVSHYQATKWSMPGPGNPAAVEAVMSMIRSEWGLLPVAILFAIMVALLLSTIFSPFALFKWISLGIFTFDVSTMLTGGLVSGLTLLSLDVDVLLFLVLDGVRSYLREKNEFTLQRQS